MSQKSNILQILKMAGSGGIHSFDLVRRANTYRVAARVNELKNDGYIISSTPERLNGVLGARYTLIDKKIEEKTWKFEDGIAKEVVTKLIQDTMF